ncbi:hypothetical protein Bbelb_340270 [Branchiostoma belcheri]|nr:hypothetical protein Bbelb_340270 [Branchiostoma belcheri]
MRGDLLQFCTPDWCDSAGENPNGPDYGTSPQDMYRWVDASILFLNAQTQWNNNPLPLQPAKGYGYSCTFYDGAQTHGSRVGIVSATRTGSTVRHDELGTSPVTQNTYNQRPEAQHTYN